MLSDDSDQESNAFAAIFKEYVALMMTDIVDYFISHRTQDLKIAKLMGELIDVIRQPDETLS